MQTKNKQTFPTLLKLTTIYGYALFAALTLSQFISVIVPFSRRPDWISSDRIIALYVGLVCSMLLPPLCSFFIGYFATKRSKTPYLRQFSGVAAGLTGLWLSHALSVISFRFMVPRPDFIPLQVYQFGYAIIAILIMLLVGFAYKRVGSKSPLHLYKPLVIVLIGSLVGWFVFNLMGGISGPVQLPSDGMLDTLSMILSVACIPLLCLLSYRYSPIKTGSIFDKIAFAALFTALYIITIEVAGGLLFSAEVLVNNYGGEALLRVFAYAIAFLIWAIYMRTISSSKGVHKDGKEKH